MSPEHTYQTHIRASVLSLAQQAGSDASRRKEPGKETDRPPGSKTAEADATPAAVMVIVKAGLPGAVMVKLPSPPNGWKSQGYSPSSVVKHLASAPSAADALSPSASAAAESATPNRISLMSCRIPSPMPSLARAYTIAGHEAKRRGVPAVRAGAASHSDTAP